MKKIFVLLVFCLFLSGCATSVKDIKENPEDYVGETVVISGVSSSSIKLGKLSGFTLKQNDGSISVSSEELPKDGSRVTVKGIVIKDSLFGVYILAKDIY